jgi:hypothetical protein
VSAFKKKKICQSLLLGRLKFQKVKLPFGTKRKEVMVVNFGFKKCFPPWRWWPTPVMLADQEDHGSKPAQANSSQDPISKKPITKRGLVGPRVQTPVPHTHTKIFFPNTVPSVNYLEEKYKLGIK